MRSSGLAILLSCAVAFAGDSTATPSRPDYRYFRALSIDLQGRPPTREEVDALAKPGFDVGAWIDAHLGSAAYAERVRRIYTDLLRLDLPNAFRYEPVSVALHRAVLEGPQGPVAVYFRLDQRRAQDDIDGTLCFTEDESGVKTGPDGSTIGKPHAIPQALFDQRTVEVKPWWLYADYRNKDPKDLAGPDWQQRFPGFELVPGAFIDPDGRSTTSIRVCKEEAQTQESGRVFASGRVVNKSTPIPKGRTKKPPADSAFARANQGQPVSCLTMLGFESSPDCGCGVGLERCMPTAPAGFVVPAEAPLGPNEPFVTSNRPASLWSQRWWADEANHFLDRILVEDRDFREVLTSRASVINGPLAQFYRFLSGARCCGNGVELGYAEPQPLFDRVAVPSDLRPMDTEDWRVVPDRGAHASGILTMPVFLIKFASRRARAHAIYSTFLCRDFLATTVKLQPSSEPDLTKRPGCATCHIRLEPLAAYFSRVAENDWTYLPSTMFPTRSERCASSTPDQMHFPCKTYYDPDFTSSKSAMLRGAYAAPAHADEGPIGIATEVTSSPEFAGCVVQNVAQSLLGRQLTPEDAEWKRSLAEDFAKHGYRMKSLVRAILTSSAYKAAGESPR